MEHAVEDMHTSTSGQVACQYSISLSRAGKLALHGFGLAFSLYVVREIVRVLDASKLLFRFLDCKGYLWGSE